jgi:hypothetical protein
MGARRQPKMASRQKKSIDQEFYDSFSQWYSMTIVPLSDRNIVLAVANGDAELKVSTYRDCKDGDWDIPDLWFRWKRQKRNRWSIYPLLIIPKKVLKEYLEDIRGIAWNAEANAREEDVSYYTGEIARLCHAAIKEFATNQEDQPTATKNHPDYAQDKRKIKCAAELLKKRGK